MSDPFEDFLEEALGGPDFELGHEIRRRLLEAAVAGDRVRPDNVVPMDRSDPDESAGFAWLVGEAPASAALMGRMVADPVFLETLDGERSFLRTLRASLRRSSAAAVAAPARTQRIAAVALSAAAALALVAGGIFMNGGGGKSASAVATAPAAQKEAPAVPAGAAEMASTSPEQITVDSGGGGGIAGPGGPLPDGTGLAKMALPDLPEHGGTGRSVDPGDPLLEVPQLQDALAFEAKESVLPEPILAALGGGMNGGLPGGETGGALAALGGENSSFSMAGGASFGGMQSGAGGMASLTGPGRDGGGRESTIPEPGGAMPVMLGLLVLLLKRPRRSKPASA